MNDPTSFLPDILKDIERIPEIFHDITTRHGSSETSKALEELGYKYEDIVEMIKTYEDSKRIYESSKSKYDQAVSNHPSPNPTASFTKSSIGMNFEYDDFITLARKTYGGMKFERNCRNPILDIRGWFCRIERLLLTLHPDTDLDKCVRFAIVQFLTNKEILTNDEYEKYCNKEKFTKWSLFKHQLNSELSIYPETLDFEDDLLKTIEFLDKPTHVKIRRIIDLLLCFPNYSLGYDFLPYVLCHEDLCEELPLLKLEVVNSFTVGDIIKALKIVLRKFSPKPKQATLLPSQINDPDDYVNYCNHNDHGEYDGMIPFSDDQIRDAQKDDPYCKQLLKHLNEPFFIQHGLLFRRRTLNKKQQSLGLDERFLLGTLILPESLKNMGIILTYTLFEPHAELPSMHDAIFRACSAYYWPNMVEDCKNHYYISKTYIYKPI